MEQKRKRFGLAGLLLWFAIAGGAAHGQAAKPVNLSADSRLDAPVTLTVSGLPLGDLLDELSANDKPGTNAPQVRLSAGGSCADLKLQMQLHNRSLRSVMAALAQLVPGEWVVPTGRDGKPLPNAYELDMTESAQAERRDWWNLFLSERASQLARMREQTLRLMRGQRVAGEQHNISDEINAQMQNSHDFFKLLPDDLARRVLANVNLHSYGLLGDGWGTGDDEGAVVVPLANLPAPAQAMVRAAIAGRGGKRPDAINWQGATITLMSDGDLFMSEFGLAGVADPRSCSLFDSNYLPPLISPEEILRPAILRPNHEGLVSTIDWMLRLHTDKAAARALFDSLPDGMKRLIQWQKRTVWPNVAPKEGKASNGHYPRPRRFRPDVLAWLGEQGRFDFISDNYFMAFQSTHGSIRLTEAEKAAPLKTPLDEELNAQAATLDMSWKRRDDGLILFRNNRWYRDDRMEVPYRLLHKWMAQGFAPLPPRVIRIRNADSEVTAAAKGNETSAGIQGNPNAPGQTATGKPAPAAKPLTPAEKCRRILDRELEFAAALTPWQIANGLRYYLPENGEDALPPAVPGNVSFAEIVAGRTYRSSEGAIIGGGEIFPFFDDAKATLMRLRSLKFYGGLLAAQREAVTENRLVFGTLTRDQQAEALTLLPGLQPYLNSPALPGLQLGMTYTDTSRNGPYTRPTPLSVISLLRELDSEKRKPIKNYDRVD